MSLPKYSQYKDSGVEWMGTVPTHWETSPVHALASFNDEVLSETTDPDHEIEYVDIGSVSLSAGIERTETFLFGNAPSRARRVVRDGDVLVSTVRTYLKAIAPVTLPAPNLVASTGFAVVRPRLGQCSGFLKYGLQCESFVQQVIARSTGVSYPAINASDLARIPLWAPPPPEQRTIADFLDRETAKIDALIAEQEKLLALLAEKRQTTLSHAVTRGLNPNAPMKDSGIPWLGEIPVHWAVRTISSLSTKITNGYVGPTRDVLVDEGVRYLQSLHIKENTIRFDPPYYVRREWSDEHGKSVLETGDVLIVQTGDIGQSTVVTEEFAGCNCHALIIVAPVRKELDGRWLSWVLNSDYGVNCLLSIQTGALHPHLNCGNVKTLSVPLPPLPEQRRVVEYVEDVIAEYHELTQVARKAVELLLERRSALISAAVSGMIDVRGLVATPEAA